MNINSQLLSLLYMGEYIKNTLDKEHYLSNGYVKAFSRQFKSKTQFFWNLKLMFSSNIYIIIHGVGDVKDLWFGLIISKVIFITNENKVIQINTKPSKSFFESVKNNESVLGLLFGLSGYKVSKNPFYNEALLSFNNYIKQIKNFEENLFLFGVDCDKNLYDSITWTTIDYVYNIDVNSNIVNADFVLSYNNKIDNSVISLEFSFNMYSFSYKKVYLKKILQDKVAFVDCFKLKDNIHIPSINLAFELKDMIFNSGVKNRKIKNKIK